MMKFKTSAMTVVMLVVIMLSVVSFAGTAVNIEINGDAVKFNSNYGYPYIDGNNRTLVPLRVTMESAGAKVSWDNDTRTAIVEKDGIVVEAPIGEKYIYVDGKKVVNDTQAVIKDGRTYLPIRAVLEAFGMNVGWDDSTRTVMVTNKTASESVGYPIKTGVDIEFDDGMGGSFTAQCKITTLPNSDIISIKQTVSDTILVYTNSVDKQFIFYAVDSEGNKELMFPCIFADTRQFYKIENGLHVFMYELEGSEIKTVDEIDSVVYVKDVSEVYIAKAEIEKAK